MGTLNSPGVLVTVNDDSFYAGAGQGTIPLIVIATEQNKPVPGSASATSIAIGTTPEEANKLRLVTSQRELVQTYGEPIFREEGGTPIHGDERNEYGLHAALQYMGIADRAFIIRADVPLDQLEPQQTAPVGPPANGTYWLDLGLTDFGVFQGNGASWIKIVPLLLDLVIAPVANSVTDAASNALGTDGDFAINKSTNQLGLFEKVSGIWYRVGTSDWIGVKGSTSLIGGGTGNATSTYAPHTGIPGTNVVPQPHDQHVWVKTTSPNQGANYVVKLYNSTTQIFTQLIAPMFDNDAAADLFYGANRSTLSLYVDYNQPNGTHVIKRWDGSNWTPLSYVASINPPTTAPTQGTLWYPNTFQVDIMVSDGINWFGYLNRYPNTDPNGPILSATAPTTQSDGTALEENDLWIDTSDMENYPQIYRWRTALGNFELVDNADQTTPNGIIFSDAREIGGVSGLTSNLLDLDAPDPLLYPSGMLMFNLRYSGFTVKEFRPNYDFGINMPAMDPRRADRWVTVSGLRGDGSPYMGRKAQRRMVVQAIQAVFVNNQEIRSEFRFFNLIAAPGYPDVIDEMITLNTDIKEVAFIVGDTPARLAPDGQSVIEYAEGQNVIGGLNGEEGRTSGIRNPYVGQWYPWGLSTNVDGTEVMVPPSTIALRTIAFNDQVSFPWFAPAGFQRGLVTNAQSVGYLTSEGEFERIILNPGQRDTLYLNNINPISDQPNRGLVVYGQKTLNPVASALDRVNVARLVNYLRFNLEELLKPFLFEPNDAETRLQVTTTVDRFLGDLVGKRALFDYGVRCDESNNTPDRIDRNELWVDVAIKPIKAIEFIYVPIRILNTGDPLPAA